MAESPWRAAGRLAVPSRSRPGKHISTRQYARLVDTWVAMIGLEPRAYGTHSLRRTKVALVYKTTGNLRACQLLLGHRKLESTVRYLGIEVDDALALSEQVDLQAAPQYRPPRRSAKGGRRPLTAKVYLSDPSPCPAPSYR